MSRQSLLSHGKTFFLTVKLTFSQQNFRLTAKLTYSKQFFRLTVKEKHFPQQILQVGFGNFAGGIQKPWMGIRNGAKNVVGILESGGLLCIPALLLRR